MNQIGDRGIDRLDRKRLERRVYVVAQGSIPKLGHKFTHAQRIDSVPTAAN